MPATRPEPAARPEEAAASAAEPAAAPVAAAGGLKAWLPLLVTVLLMPALAFAMTRFVLVPQIQKGIGMTPAKGETPAASGKEGGGVRESVPLNKLLVNVAGTMGARYLQVSLSVVGNDPDFKAKMQAHDPQLRDLACGALATKTLADLEKPGARNVIRSELISGFNNILGGSTVQEIYLTEFAIQ